MRGPALVALALLFPRVATSQAPGPPGVTLEARFDGIIASRATMTHLGLGLTRRASRNLDLQVVVGGGVTLRAGRDEPNASGRADLLTRFAPPPTSPDRWTGYAAGGVSALVERGARGRAVLALLAGARGRRAFVEAGLGGGVRLGAGVRF